MDARSSESKLTYISSAQKPNKQLVHRNNQQHWKGKQRPKVNIRPVETISSQVDLLQSKLLQRSIRETIVNVATVMRMTIFSEILPKCDKDDSESQLPKRKRWENKKHNKGQVDKKNRNCHAGASSG